MTATLLVRHKVGHHAAWRNVDDELEPLRSQHGCTAKRVMQLPDDANDLLITHDFPSVEQASNVAHDPAVQTGMAQAGVDGAPRIEILAVV